MRTYVYLAGPIAGCSEDEAKSWREYVGDALAASGHAIIGVSPLRCEPPVDGHYDIGSARDDPKFGSPKAINAKNRLDTERADIVLAYMPTRPELSVGTLFEIAWASWAGKPVLLVTDDPRLLRHPLVRETCAWVLPTLDDAVEVLIGVLGVYSA